MGVVCAGCGAPAAAAANPRGASRTPASPAPAAFPCPPSSLPRPLKEGDIVNIDVTVYLDGYHGAPGYARPRVTLAALAGAALPVPLCRTHDPSARPPLPPPHPQATQARCSTWARPRRRRSGCARRRGRRWRRPSRRGAGRAAEGRTGGAWAPTRAVRSFVGARPQAQPSSFLAAARALRQVCGPGVPVRAIGEAVVEVAQRRKFQARRAIRGARAMAQGLGRRAFEACSPAHAPPSCPYLPSPIYSA